MKLFGGDLEDDIKNWYFLFECILMCLFKLYRCVEIKIFAGLA